jgi:hypothetical protein
MKAIRRDSHCGDRLFRLVEALLDYYVVPAEFEQACQRLWPDKLDIYKGSTHWRILPHGNPAPERGVNVYVDLTA